MARIYPFRAFRYDPSRVNLEDVVTQPYDKITPEMQQRYYDASPYNLIRVILGKHEAGDNETTNVYSRAAETLTTLREDKILKEESEPALYGYSQTYTVPHTDEVRERRGFIALGHLYDYADHVVYRHEQTFPKHKSDRLALFKATRAYCEQIYMLYSDPAFTAEKLIFGEGKSGGNAPDLAITDEYGVVHRVWKLTDPTLINLILTAMADKKLIIADGHHRYETSVTYSKERAAELGVEPGLLKAQEAAEDEESPSGRADESAQPLPTPPYPEAAMMMTFVNMEAPGITILPTHRVVFGLKDFDRQAFLAKAEEFFTITPVTDHGLAKLTSAQGTAFLAVTRGAQDLLVAKPEAMKRALSDMSPRQAQLDVVQLHRIVLEHLLNLTHESIARLENIRYLREADEAVAQVEKGEADIAFLIKPVTLTQLRDISLALEVMPQKSTDFYPKLLTGLAIYALD
ncbi:DUF1015 domain-containing protein [Granulicella sibirica]|uniref:DUF1015 domain-containing protein n=1 Tax=Granulicella sibirica TaxID=2479048 RepID=A0A4Q0T275_9BACT|nr:DUF1015 domain-containing protein [Granulicella sibirica]RXH56932.1 hypothetical protein GRAN_0242 [Granulicella sibirica]